MLGQIVLSCCAGPVLKWSWLPGIGVITKAIRVGLHEALGPYLSLRCIHPAFPNQATTIKDHSEIGLMSKPSFVLKMSCIRQAE